MKFVVDEELLKTCMEKAYPGSTIRVRDYVDGQYAVQAGTNYSSEIMRVRVDLERDGRPMRHFVVFKVPFLSAHYAYLNEFGFYDKETYMYEAVLPKMVRLLDGAVAPAHYLTTHTHVLALEDLSERGYRLEGGAAFGPEYCARALDALAQFHAASVRLQQRDAALLAPAWREALYTEDIVRNIMAACYPPLTDALRRCGVASGTVRAFAAYEARINERMASGPAAAGGGAGICHVSDRLTDFNVLNHGDLKTNNIMYRTDGGGQPTDVKLLDYQTCRWNSPVLDLVFFAMATMDYAVYQQHYDWLLERYLTTLNRTLSRLDCECAYTVDQYVADVAGCRLFRVFTLVWIGFLDLREAIPGFDYDNPVPLHHHQIQKLHEHRSFSNRFFKWFTHFHESGFFD